MLRCPFSPVFNAAVAVTSAPHTPTIHETTNGRVRLTDGRRRRPFAMLPSQFLAIFGFALTLRQQKRSPEGHKYVVLLAFPLMAEFWASILLLVLRRCSHSGAPFLRSDTSNGRLRIKRKLSIRKYLNLTMCVMPYLSQSGQERAIGARETLLSTFTFSVRHS